MGKRSVIALCLLLGVPLVIVTGGTDNASEKGKEADAKGAKSAITPELDRCTLEAKGRTLKPVFSSSPKQQEHVVKDLRIQLEGATLRAFKNREENPQWTAKAPGETELAWLAVDEKVIYLSAYKIDK
jgi:hypothetical protein